MVFPTTRYQGAKTRLLPALEAVFRRFPVHSCLDAFGGTGAVSHLFKRLGLAVTYNDALRFNLDIGRALIENDADTLDPAAAAALPQRAPGVSYRAIIQESFRGVYFTDEENHEIDAAIQNSERLPGYQAHLARFALYQACLAKRPYNLFHRANLSLRLRDVPRSFGNKTSWDRPLADHLRRFTEEANRAIFRGARPCRALHGDALAAPGEFDLVYADPPYVPRRGRGVDYLGFYHFLEGLAEYHAWPGKIDHSRAHRPLRAAPSPWSDPAQIRAQLAALFDRFQRSILALSYRADGQPSPDEIERLLLGFFGRVERLDLGAVRYALSLARGSRELLFVAHPRAR